MLPVRVAGVGRKANLTFADLGEAETALAIRARVAAGLAVAVEMHVGASDGFVVGVHHLAGELQVRGLEFNRVDFDPPASASVSGLMNLCP